MLSKVAVWSVVVWIQVQAVTNRTFNVEAHLDHGATVSDNTTHAFRKLEDPRAFNGTILCQLECEQGTILYPNNSCRCVCKKNFALHNDTNCEPASWLNWSSWSKCLRSEWGGLQVRERICKSEGSDSPGACNGRGSMARTCTDITKEFRIRKNLNDLLDEELHDLLQAMTKFKQDTSMNGYWNIVSWHGYPGRCRWNENITGHENNHCSWHHHPLFQPWHRLIMVQLELGLSKHLKNKTLGIPYWDWTVKANDVPDLLKKPKIYDPILKKYVTNPFYKTLIKIDHGLRVFNERKPDYRGLLMDRYLLKGTVRALMCHDYYNYDSQHSFIPHDQIHNCMCVNGACDFGMPTTSYAAYDPIFMVHHSAMDRLFVMRRELEELYGVADWTKSRVVGQYAKSKHESPRDIRDAFDWPLSPFCNRSMNPEPVTGREGMWLLSNAYYNEQLFGYKYDNFDLGSGYKWEVLRRDFRRNVIDRDFWNDDHFVTELGDLTKANSHELPRLDGCAVEYSNPGFHVTIDWK